MRVRDVELHWAELGSGPPLVLLHGLCDSHRTWFPVAPRSRVSAASSCSTLPVTASQRVQTRATRSTGTRNMVGAWLESLASTRSTSSAIRSAAAWRSGCSSSIASAFGGSASSRPAGSVARSAPRSDGRRSRFSSNDSANPSCRSARRARSMPRGARSRTRKSRFLQQYNARPGTARAFSRSVRDVINGWGQHRHFLDRAHEVPVTAAPRGLLGRGRQVDSHRARRRGHGTHRRRHSHAVSGGRALSASASARALRGGARTVPGRASSSRRAPARDQARRLIAAPEPSSTWSRHDTETTLRYRLSRPLGARRPHGPESARCR